MIPIVPRMAQPDIESPSDELFDSLFREHYAGMWRFVTRLVGSPEVAEDIVQDVMFSVWRSGKWKNEDLKASFLYVSVRNAAFNYRRREKLEESTIREGVLAWEQKYIDAAEKVNYDEVAQAVREAINSLPERCRMIYLMNREEGLSYSEIAKILGLSGKTVDAQMGKAVKRLRAWLTEKLVIFMVASMAVAGRFMS